MFKPKPKLASTERWEAIKSETHQSADKAAADKAAGAKAPAPPQQPLPPLRDDVVYCMPGRDFIGPNFHLQEVWPANQGPLRHKVTLVVQYAKDVHPGVRAKLIDAGLGEYLEDPGDEVIYGEARVVSQYGTGTLGPKAEYTVAEIVQATRDFGSPVAERRRLEEENAAAQARQRAEREAEELRKTQERQEYERERVEAERMRDPRHLVKQVAARLMQLESQFRKSQADAGQ